MNIVDRAIAVFSPMTALRRAQARRALSYYEAGRTDKQRKQRRSINSGNVEVRNAGRSIREQARHFDENHDIGSGALNILVAAIVGQYGTQIEPQPRRKDGTIHTEAAKILLSLWKDWGRRPEVTWMHDWPAAERLSCRTWCRDGEMLAQMIEGLMPSLDHGTRVPFSIELLEPDYLPLDLDDFASNVVQGIQVNTWGRPVAYHVYRQHPGNLAYPFGRAPSLDRKVIPASRMLHPGVRNRLHQLRGVSLFASVMSRLDDLKDYEESERIAAKVAASMAAYIRKGTPDLYGQETDDSGDPVARDIKFRPGMVFDDLLPGEDIGTIDTSRPNTNLAAHRDGQLRAAAAGFRVSHSSLSKNYNGTYSAQRQELVEQYGIYGMLQSDWVGQFTAPIYSRFVAAAIASGQLVLPADLDVSTVDDALFLSPQVPWIDPMKEAVAWETLERNGHASGPEIVRRRGRNPRDVIEQEAEWRQQWRDKGESLGVSAPETQATTAARIETVRAVARD